MGRGGKRPWAERLIGLVWGARDGWDQMKGSRAKLQGQDREQTNMFLEKVSRFHLVP